MAIQTMVLDPNAQSYTDDEIVGKVNTAAANITRAGSVDAVARPIGAGEVDATALASGAVDDSKLSSGASKANLDAMGDTARGYIQTNPAVGEFPIISIQRDAAGLQASAFDDVPIV